MYNVWNDSIENKSNDQHDLDDNKPIYKSWFIQKFN